MSIKDNISKELRELHSSGVDLIKFLQEEKDQLNFPFDYQTWYSKALRVTEVLAPDRYDEFTSYYKVNPKRKSITYGTYVIQDYLKGIAPSSYSHPGFDSRGETSLNLMNQIAILNSLKGRLDSVLTRIDTELLSELQNAELATAQKLKKISLRAAGALAGVVIESHLLKLTQNHKLKIKKKNPAISDMNDLLKNEQVFDTPTWRKTSYLGDIRNICSHKKEQDPTIEQVNDIISGANWLVQNTF